MLGKKEIESKNHLPKSKKLNFAKSESLQKNLIPKLEVEDDLSISESTEENTNSNLSWKIGFVIVSILLILSTFFSSFLFFERQQALAQNDYGYIKTEILEIMEEQGLEGLPSPEKQKEGEIKGLVSSLEDPYSSFMPQAENKDFQDSLNQRYEGIGVVFEEIAGTLLVTQVFEESPAFEAEILAGDILVAVEGESVNGQNLTEVAQNIRGPRGSQVKLKFIRENEELDFEVTRDKIETELIRLEIINTTAVLTISSFGENLDELMQSKAKKILDNSEITEIIIDVRGNSGGLLTETIEIVSYFVEPDQTILYEVYKDNEIKVKSLNKGNLSLKEYPVAVLIDRNSASASEILAGSLRDLRAAKLIGQNSFGKGTVQNIFSLKTGDKLRLTIAKWLTPKKSEIDKVGLEPDIKTEEDLSQEEILQKAKESLQN